MPTEEVASPSGGATSADQGQGQGHVEGAGIDTAALEDNAEEPATAVVMVQETIPEPHQEPLVDVDPQNLTLLCHAQADEAKYSCPR